MLRRNAANIWGGLKRSHRIISYQSVKNGRQAASRLRRLWGEQDYPAARFTGWLNSLISKKCPARSAHYGIYANNVARTLWDRFCRRIWMCLMVELLRRYSIVFCLFEGYFVVHEQNVLIRTEKEIGYLDLPNTRHLYRVRIHRHASFYRFTLHAHTEPL